MRKEPFSINNYVHVYNRGNRKQAIVHNAKDREHFLQMLYYFNTEKTSSNPLRNQNQLLRSDLNSWPEGWEPRKPIIKIIAFVLMENHFHLLLKEIIEGGIAKFMQRLGTGMTMYYNIKYQESGRLFQGAYKARCVNDDLYLKYLSVYIQVKNSLELYSGGLKKAIKEFDKAFNWAVNYQYSSLGDFVGVRNCKIIDKDIFSELFPSPKEYKEFARDCMHEMNLDDVLVDLTFET